LISSVYLTVSGPRFRHSRLRSANDY